MTLGRKRKRKSKIERQAERKPRELTGSQMVERIRQGNIKEQDRERDTRDEELVEDLKARKLERQKRRAERLRNLIPLADGQLQSETIGNLEKYDPGEEP